jgi:hypothetical protein
MSEYYFAKNDSGPQTYLGANAGKFISLFHVKIAHGGCRNKIVKSMNQIGSLPGRKVICLHRAHCSSTQ